MKKKLVALLCVLTLLCLMLPSTLAAEQMYFVAVNDNMLDYAPDTQPIKLGATMYVPFTVFLSEFNGGVKLGVFYARDKQLNTLSLYGRQKPILTFDYGAGTTYDTMDNMYNYRAIVRNNTVYLPAWAVSNYFDLECTYSATDFGDLIRIKSQENCYLGDQFFLSSATDNFREQRKQFDRVQQGEVATPSPQPTPSPTPTAPNGQKKIAVSFAFRCDTGTGPASLLDSLDRWGQKALFLFRPEDMARWDDHIRRLTAQGHRIGVIVTGGTAAECEAQAQEGNRLLRHIARTSTDFLLVEGNDALRQELTGKGWVCWTTNVSGLSLADTRGSALAANLLTGIDARRSYARVLMNDSTLSGQALTALLPQLRGDAYLLAPVTEGGL